MIEKFKRGFGSCSVLIIEDDQDVAASMSKIFKLFFKECTVATDGENGLELYRSRFHANNPFSLVVTDLELPKMGGLRVIREIRELSQEQPVLILSAHDEAEFMAEAINLNVYGYLLKPLSMPKLFESLDKILSIQNIMKNSSSSDVDEVTQWQKYPALAQRLKDLDSESVTILYMRINHLSSMYNIIGRTMANGYLSELVPLLESMLTQNNGTFYRTGTDEIAIVLDGDKIEYAADFAKNLLSIVRYFHTSEHGIILNSTISIGIASGRENTLLHAKLALAKTRRTLGEVAFFTQNSKDINYPSVNGQDILKMISNAINEENIIPFIQPIADMKSNNFEIFQALIRIQDGEQLYKPEHFLRFTMDIGQISMITRAMIKNTFMYANNLPDNAILCISLTVYDLNDESMLSYINFWAQRCSIATQRIVFQIKNEIELMENRYIFTFIKELQKNGYKIMLDDFGFTQSNFANLLELQPEYIKLQHDTIQRLQDGSTTAKIIHKIVDIAHLSGSKVVISHISTHDQIKYAKNANIDLIQGFEIETPYKMTDE